MIRTYDASMVTASVRSSGGWPSLAYEEVSWAPEGLTALPQRDRALQQQPYRAAVVPQIALAQRVPLSGEVQSLAEEAAVTIARFDAEVGAALAPFEPLLLRSEASASSQIENLTASAKAVALAEIHEGKRRTNAEIVVANTRAMHTAIELADRLDVRSILEMHRALLESSQPATVGRWRQEQVWIGGRSSSPHGALFVPPVAARVPGAMGDLVTFMRRYDVPPFVLAAVAHAQFETIHPFPDGNGRTGRSLLHALLRAKGLTTSVTVPVSAGILTDTDRYFTSLTAYREGEPGAIVELLATSAFAAVDNGRRLVADLQDAREAWSERITARRDAAAHRLADLLIHQPVITSAIVQEQLDVAPSNALAAIDHLVGHDILKKVSVGSRNRVWSAPEVLEALDDFAARAGRRDRPDETAG
jgi:Fic family protein